MSEWISVKDRMPEDYGSNNVLACFDDKTIATVDCYRCPEYDNYFWQDEVTCEDLYGVTHWMPLPEPPKGAK